MASEPSASDSSDDIIEQSTLVDPDQAMCPVCGGFGLGPVVAPSTGNVGRIEHRPRQPWANGESGDIEPSDVVERLRFVLASLERDLVGFRPLLIQSLYALLTRENLLIFSPAGTAKTLFASSIFSRISGAKIFDTQMSKGTLAEELFGSIDTELLKRGRIVHNTRGTLEIGRAHV